MATATTLEQAAKQAWANLAVLATAGTLRAQLIAFCTTVRPLFNGNAGANPGDHPTANWIAVLWAFADQMDAVADDWPALRVAADYVYRLCFMTEQARTGNTPPLITQAQYDAVLASYNAEF